jgi:branched-chain amino acid transport system substrate-binding protein
MRNKKLYTALIMICLTLVLAALPFVSACSTSVQTEKTLKVGMMTPTTGVAAEKGVPLGHANLDAIEYVNTELGGVNGYPIEVVWLDSNYNAGQSLTNVKRFMDENCLLFTTSASTEMGFVQETANRAEFPGIVAFSSPSNYRPPAHIYGMAPDYGDDWAAFAKYYIDNIWQGDGKPKMALLLLNNPTGAGARNAAMALADQLGIEILWDGQVGKGFEHTSTTISEIESLTRIKAMNPDIIYISSTPQPTSVIIKNAVELGMYPEIPIAVGHAGMTDVLVNLAGADITEGVYGVISAASWGDDVPGMAKLVEYCQQLHPKDEGNTDYLTAWAQSLIVAEILKKAVENVGYDVLDQGGVEAWRAVEQYGIQKLDGYDVEGLQSPVSYTAGDNRLSKSLRIFQVQQGEINPITDWVDAPLIKYEEYSWFGK